MLSKLIVLAVGLSTLTETAPAPALSFEAGKAVFLDFFICQNEVSARSILDAWLSQGENGRDTILAEAVSLKGTKIPTLAECTIYQGAMTPIRNIARWDYLMESREVSGYISISLAEVEIYPGYASHRVFAFLTEDIQE